MLEEEGVASSPQKGEKKRLLADSPTSEGKRNSILLGVSVLVIVVLLFAILITVIFLRNPKNRFPPPINVYSSYFSSISADSLKASVEYYSSFPHLAGTDEDQQQALRTKDVWNSWGISTKIEEFNVMLSYPQGTLVELLQPEYYNCSLKEAVLPDGTSSDPRAVTPWNGYSAAGEATGLLVYVNYGRQEDFDAISHIDLNQTIVIVRYGEIFRGNKVQLAQQRGAIGVIIYVDPEDTGYLQGNVYMSGPWSNNATVQRGTVWTGNGDPTTPGWPSTEDAPRLTYEEAQTGDW